MDRITELRQKVDELYNSKLPTREAWADWLYPNHVLIVAASARKLAKKYGASVELAEAAALLHDVADYITGRKDSEHEAKSLKTARDVMQECGYADREIALVVDDAIRYHSCHGDERPESTEGLVLTTADSLAHLKTDFYIYATWVKGKEQTLQEVKDWTLKKIERDLYNKIQFEDERNDAAPDYEMIKTLFSR